jgi:hypothetical protein
MQDQASSVKIVVRVTFEVIRVVSRCVCAIPTAQNIQVDPPCIFLLLVARTVRSSPIQPGRSGPVTSVECPLFSESHIKIRV